SSPGGDFPAEPTTEVRRGDLLIRAWSEAPAASLRYGLLLETAARIIELSRRRQPGTNRPQRPPAGGAPALPSPLSIDPYVQEVYRQAARVARGDISVLIQGESGTGKELLARYMHEGSAKDKFIALNCAALPRDLLELELFGIERAVATGVDARPGKFELADRGTLFLDEIGDMGLETQAKILRVLQEQ
ncbi:MAG: sigma 54-interacting transcriptional regulator, partial [Acidobacteria bacterium]|nr:sigma 54-interacting transcriptional regulator [Acidobacteriota bacterium]